MKTYTRISVHCRRCGEVKLAPEQLWLVLTDVPGHAHYGFRCPRCAVLVRSAADEKTVSSLATLVAVEEIDVPAEALEPHTGPVLTFDDLIDLVLALEADAKAAQASGAEPGDYRGQVRA